MPETHSKRKVAALAQWSSKDSSKSQISPLTASSGMTSVTNGSYSIRRLFSAVGYHSMHFVPFALSPHFVT